jgi:hypothetical protein
LQLDETGLIVKCSAGILTSHIHFFTYNHIIILEQFQYATLKTGGKEFCDEKYGDGMMSAKDMDREAKEAELKALDKKISLGSTLTTVF